MLVSANQMMDNGEGEPCDWARMKEAVIVLAGEKVLWLGCNY